MIQHRFKKTSKNRMLTGLLLFLAVTAATAWAEAPQRQAPAPRVVERIGIDLVWSPMGVGFALHTHGDKQYIAYYNNQRQMVIGMRRLGEPQFVTNVLADSDPSVAGITYQSWDTHNYVTLAIDERGYVHLAGNMHNDPLIYFRSEQPGDITRMQQIRSMVGDLENRCTYPKFMGDPDGSLIFHYRHGGSGNGIEIFNRYDARTQTWQRLYDQPLIDGEGQMNAYQNGPLLGPDGWYHLLWVWRETANAETNRDLSYARSKDMRQWETAAGQPLKLPITHSDSATIVDPIPVNGGIINGCHKMGFDSQNRLVVAYHKHDEQGDTQAYAAQFKAGRWQIRQISDWQGTHIFKGRGSAPSSFGTSLGLGQLFQVEPGRMGLMYSHWKAGGGVLVFDEATLEPVRVDPPRRLYPPDVMRVRSDFPGMRPHLATDSGTPPTADTRYVLKWENLGANRDRPRPKPWPEDSGLILYQLEDR